MDSLSLLPFRLFAGGMALSGFGRIMRVEKGRTLLYISRRLVEDSAFPFRPGDRVALTIDARGKRLIVERMPGGRPASRR